MFDAPLILRYNRFSFAKELALISFTIRPRAFALACATAVLIFLSSSLTSSAPISASTLDSPFPHDTSLRAADAPTTALVPSGHLIVSAEANGAWNIFSTDPTGSAWQPISSDRLPARDPAVSPDGKTIAFRSKRDGTWDIYSMLTNGGAATRLTRGMIYSGAPVWSPDGKRIAFESYAHGDLDIWTTLAPHASAGVTADGTQPLDLTDDSKAQDYGPAWSPDGKWIAFTSWRTGTQQIFVVAADCKAA
jgi:WD40 repeat protein